MESKKLSATVFVERLETERATFDDELHPLPTYQKDAFERCYKLVQDKGSFARRSRQYRSAKLRARTLLTDVFNDLGAEVFLLCTLITTITTLSTVTHRDLFPKLRAWWKAAEHPRGLTLCANGLCDASTIGALQEENAGKSNLLAGNLVQSTEVVPQVPFLADQAPPMTLNLDLSDLISFLRQYETSCPTLQMMCPLFGDPLPSITIKSDSLDGCNAKFELSLRTSEALMKHMLGSRAATVKISD